MACRLKTLSHVAILGVFSLVAAAVLLGREQAWPGSKSPSGVRRPAPPRYHAFSGYLFRNDQPHATRLLDTETGRVTLLDITGAETFDMVSCSPWSDGSGQYQLSGRRIAPRFEPQEGSASVVGIARCAFPVGQVLERIAFELLPAAPPCWYPDGSDRVVFAAGDGHLYDVAFSGDERTGQTPAAIQPRRIRWRADAPGRGLAYIQDPCWPGEPALAQRLLAGVRFRHPGSRSYGRLRLWWLRLSENGMSVVEAEPLILPARASPDASPARGEERCPCVGMTREGLLMLAYMVIREAQKPGELWVAPVAFESRHDDRVPRVYAATARLVASACVPAAPAFSSDGRWIYTAIREGPNAEVQIRRFAVPPLADRRPTAREVAYSGPVP
jgi:hypothetical protein